MLQNSSVSPVAASATYRLQPRLRQNGMRSVRMLKLSMKSLPNHKGGGRLKMSLRAWLANTNMK